MNYNALFKLTKAPVKITLTNTCTCSYLDENDEEVQAEYCDGFCWECECDYIESLGIVGKSWHVDAEDIGWRNLSGTKDFHCTSGAQFLQEIVGMDTEYTIQIVAKRRKPATLTAYVYHHDSPMGELREIRRIR